MCKEKFNMILNKNEEIIWCRDINVSASTKKRLFVPISIITVFSYIIMLLIYTFSNLLKFPFESIFPYLIFLWIIACAMYISTLNRDGKNTFLCITNERIIKTSGAFNNKFDSYSLKNVGTIMINQGIFDGKGENSSATLTVLVKDYHTNTSHSRAVIVYSLNNAYEAYKILNELTKGNNEVLRIKEE